MVESRDLTTTPVSLFSRETQVRTLQYKITVFLIALALFISRPFLQKAWNDYSELKKEHVLKMEQYNAKVIEQSTIKKDIEVLQQAGGLAQRGNIIQCYNSTSSSTCQSLPETLRVEPTKDIFRHYLQLQQASTTKFVFDQKKVLAYLNEFLVGAGNGVSNGQIKNISFGAVSSTTMPGLVKIPLSVTIAFPNKNGLLVFLRNIEKLISPTYPMLAMVQSVSYDVVKPDTAQDVGILIDVYMLQ